MDERRLWQPSQRGPHQAVELHIGELVLDGFPAGHGAQIGAFVRQELSRLLAEGGAPARLAQEGDVASLDGGDLQLAPDSSPQAIGSQIARAVYGGLGR